MLHNNSNKGRALLGGGLQLPALPFGEEYLYDALTGQSLYDALINAPLSAGKGILV